MSKVPLSGILTFLFTDLEESTPRWEQHPDLMQIVSARHDELLRAVFEGNGGQVVKTTGDGFHVVFTSPADGIAAALAGQQAMTTEIWPAEVGKLKIRMGLHTGEGQAREGDYYGPELNRAARLMGLGHGGQVLVSGMTAALLRGRLPDGAELIDLGLHKLKGLAAFEQVFQLVHSSLESVFPPLKSSVTIPHNLPNQLTSFIGRSHELEEIIRLMEESRLLTLFGSGGTGKTRLMLRAGRDLINRFSDGAWLVELAALTSPQNVMERTADVLGVRGLPNRSLVESLGVYLRRKDMLLLLDNAEHLIQATAELVEQLLTLCPKLKILVTSREPLSIGGETAFQVPSLSLPKQNVMTEIEMEASEAVQLFLDRARIVRPKFELTTSNIPAIAQIVRQLDGIPLALELAAARLRVMSAEQIAARLNDRFRLLVTGSRTSLPRQQTLRALIDWSWNLLERGEQVLLRRLSVFSGGWFLEDAQRVADDSKLDEFAILDNLEALVQKSLVIHSPLPDDDSRFLLLESIRQYAQERLIEAGEEDALAERHAGYYVGLIREAEAAHTQTEMLIWIERLAQETDNFRAAFNWLEIHDPLLILATTGKLMLLHGQGFSAFSQPPLPEARRWLERAIHIGRTTEVSEVTRKDRNWQLGLSLGALCSICFALGSHEDGVAAGAEAVTILRPLGETQPLAYALANNSFNLGYLGRLGEAYEAGQEARKIARKIGDWVSHSIALAALAMATLMRGDFERTHKYVKESKNLSEELGSSWIGPQILMVEGYLYANIGDLEGAEAIFREADQRFRDLKNPSRTIPYRSELAHTLRRQEKWEQALPIYKESILFYLDISHEPAVANQLESFAYIAIALKEPEKAARLLGAADAIRERTNSPISIPWEETDYDQARKQLAEILGRAERDTHVKEGRSLTLDEAVALARSISIN